MLTYETRVTVDGLAASDIFDFLVDPVDAAYQRWWPGVHLQLHPIERGEDHVGDVIYMDEYIGARRVRMTGIVLEASRPRKLGWQLKKVISLPAWLSLELRDTADGVAITHRTRVGFAGRGRVLDPLWRLFFSKSFAAELDEHVRTEFPLLRDRLGDMRAETS